MSLGDAARNVSEHASAIAKLELELARREMSRRAATIGVGIGLGVGAALIAVIGLCFAIAGGAAGLAEMLPTWAAILCIAGALLLAALVLGLAAAASLRRAAPPVPREAIEEAKRTVHRIREVGRNGHK